MEMGASWGQSDFVQDAPEPPGGPGRQGAVVSLGLLSEPLPDTRRAACDLRCGCLSRRLPGADVNQGGTCSLTEKVAEHH